MAHKRFPAYSQACFEQQTAVYSMAFTAAWVTKLCSLCHTWKIRPPLLCLPRKGGKGFGCRGRCCP